MNIYGIAKTQNRWTETQNLPKAKTKETPHKPNQKHDTKSAQRQQFADDQSRTPRGAKERPIQESMPRHKLVGHTHRAASTAGKPATARSREAAAKGIATPISGAPSDLHSTHSERETRIE